ncbi:deoxyribodipyrimidine photo-lyase [Paracoccus sp. S1E-3]|uniref:cryptochrome/photolyase family protein n=1 Tax=Paracoccus sp. S1E-3 TaxID=2756130 RepID=UPI0015EF4795|nr:deoxyribodipyrimidine photo-lyase [Paracoccus sp. S1E-3]MBA4491612.1 deoxyribodipyrimidine photo-lyase [Paracoccus sp. S1E-3]
MGGTIWWIRRDARQADNAALAAAAAAGPVTAVFLIEPVLRAQGAATRWRLGRALAALDADLRARGGALTVRTGAAEDILPRLAAELGAAEVHALAWPEPKRIVADEAARTALNGAAVQLVLHDGATLLPPAAIRNAQGKPFRVQSAFSRAARALGVSPPVRMPAHIEWRPAPSEQLGDLAPDMNRGAAVLAAHARPAGEAAALMQLHAFLDGPVEDYAHSRERIDRPGGCTALSEALAVGEIGPRTIWAAVADHSGEGPQKLLSELMWREFAWSLLVARPDLPVANFRPEWDRFPWQGDGPAAEAWRRAVTGIPLVDAGMREMFVTGTMHNRVRMVVASFLCKHLLTDWRVGLAWFGDCLTDWDPASNAMNWQWVAGSGPDAAPYFRVFNPALQAEKFDPTGAYRSRWLSPNSGYFEAVPRSWGLQPSTRLHPVISLAEGRGRALDALSRMKGAG